MSVAKRPGRSRLDIGAANRFIQHGLASSSGISLTAWRERKKAERDEAASRNAANNSGQKGQPAAEVGTGATRSAAPDGPILAYSGAGRSVSRSGNSASNKSKYPSTGGSRRGTRKSKNRSLVLSSDNTDSRSTVAVQEQKMLSSRPSDVLTVAKTANESGQKRRATRSGAGAASSRNQQQRSTDGHTASSGAEATVPTAMASIKRYQPSQQLAHGQSIRVQVKKRSVGGTLTRKALPTPSPPSTVVAASKTKPLASPRHRPSSRFVMLQSPPFHLVSNWAPLDTLAIAIPQVRWKRARHRSFDAKRRKWQILKLS